MTEENQEQPVEETANEEAAAEETPAAEPGELCESKILETLKQVIDPELFVNVVDLGLVYEVEIRDSENTPDKKDVTVEMTLTSPACPAGPQIVGQSKEVILRLDETDDVEIKLVMSPPWSPDRMTEDARDHLGIF